MKKIKKIKILKKRANFFLKKKNIPNIISGKFLKSGDLSTYLFLQTKAANELKSHHSEKNLIFFVKKKLDLLMEPIELRVWKKLGGKKKGQMATTEMKKQLKKRLHENILLAVPAWPHRQFVQASNLFKTQARNRKDRKKLLQFLFKSKKQKKQIISPQEKKKRDASIGVLTPEISVNFSERIKMSLFDLTKLEQSKIHNRLSENLHLAVDYNITSRDKRKRWY